MDEGRATSSRLEFDFSCGVLMGEAGNVIGALPEGSYDISMRARTLKGEIPQSYRGLPIAKRDVLSRITKYAGVFVIGTGSITPVGRLGWPAAA